MSENGEKKEVTEAKASESASEKKPYVAPKLRHLGSVRDLTLGSASDQCDGALNPGGRLGPC